MQKKTLSIVLCLAMLFSVLALAVPANAATVESAAAGISKIESAGDFSWDNANVYFLLTDRFYNGNTSNDHSYGRTLDANGNPLSGWQSNPGTFHGGDFAGLTQKINEGYFNDLGVNAIWISAPYEQIHGYVTPGDPLDFSHYSYHGYYVLDYTETDANFGTKAEFKTMVDTAHKHGIRVVMDVVMNHAGYNTIKDMLEFNFGSFKDKSAATSYLYKLTGVNGLHSTVDYENSVESWGRWWSTDWVRSGLPGYEEGGGEVTGMLAGLPDFRTESSKQVSIPPVLQTKWQQEGTYNQKIAKYGSSGTVSDYLTTWLAEWVETYGVDGFRCDTAKHVENASWKKLKDKCVAALNKWRQNNPTSSGADWDEDFWMTGECWGHGLGRSPFYSEGGFDSMINFSITGSTSGSNGMPEAGSVNSMYQTYADTINSDPTFNALTYLSSHDTNLVRNNPYWQGTAFQLLPGEIQIFYGDETSRPLVSGVPVGGDGHAVRSDMNWGQNTDLLRHWQKVGRFRANHVAVGAGEHRQISAYSASAGYTFARTYSDDNVSDGVVCCIGAPVNTSISVNVSSVFGNGKTVTNEYDGTTAVVQNGKATFNSGAHGVILISGPMSSIKMALKGGKTAFYDSQTVTLSLRGADYAMVSVNGGTAFRAVDGQSFTIGEEVGLGESFDVVLTASNGEDTAEMTYTFRKKDPTAVTRIYFDNSAYNWSNVNAYVYDESGASVVENAAWPGNAMELDSATGYYVYEVDEDLADAGAVVFNDGGNQYPAEGVRLDIGGTDMILLNGTQWVPYNGQIAEPTDPPAPGTQRTIYLDNSSMGCSNPCIYVWKNNTTECPVQWPGTAMTPAPEIGSSFYKYTCDAKYDCCIFLDGSSKKTDDIKNIPYLSAVYNGSWSEMKPVDITPTQPTDPTVPTQPTDSVQPTNPSGNEGLVGDADLNGRITIKDVTAIQRHLAHLDYLTGDALKTADGDQNGSVTIKDATYIQVYLAEKLTGYAHCGEVIALGGSTPTQPTQPQPTQPQTQPAGTRTIYLDNSKFSASEPYIYVWKQGTNDSMSAWPGTAMTDEGNNIYSFTCPEEYNCCIFSRDGGSNSKISGDLENIPYTAAIYDGAWREYNGGTIPVIPTTPTAPTNPNPSDDYVTLDASDANTGTEEWYAWTWNDTTDGAWVKGNGQPSAVVFTGVKSNIIFTRMNPECNGNPDWGYVWNKTSDLTTQYGKTYKAADWLRGGSWQ